VLAFLRTLWELDHALQTASKSMARRRGITGPQRVVLRIVGRFPQLAPSQLAAIVHLHPSTLTGILKRLEGRGLIKRRVDPNDRRRSFLVLTPKGRAIDVDDVHTVERVLATLFATLPPAQTAATQRTLRALAEALQRSAVEP
jgi:DNA-binding MarR family transcriptional regulator